MQQKKKQVWAYILIICMTITTMFSETGFVINAEGVNISDGTVDMNVTSVTVNGTALTESTEIKNGDELKIQFDWELADGDTTLLLCADLNPVNVEFSDTVHRELQDKTDNYAVIGEYWVENNKLWIQLDESAGYQNKTGRTGGATIFARVNVSDAGIIDGDPVEFKIAGTTVNGTFDDGQSGSGGGVDSGIGVEKKVSGSVTPVTVGSDTVYRQTYRIKLWAYGGDITSVSISDTFGDSLENMSSFTVVESSNDIFMVGSTYATIDDINAAFSGQTFLQDKPVIFEYTMDIKADKVQGALSGSPDDTYKNTLTGTCTNSGGETHTMNSSAWVTATLPLLQKTGTLSADNKTATWTITINLNGTNWNDITSITDTPGVGFVGANVGVALDKNNFTETSPGVYTYTYTTSVDESFNAGINGTSVRNDVSITTTTGNTYSGSGTVTLPGITDWVSKEFVSYDEATKTITWKITVDVPAGVTDVSISDRIRTDIGANAGNHKTENMTVYIDGIKVAEGVTSDANGNMWGNIVTHDSNSDGVNDILTEINWKGLNISNEYIGAGGKTIEVTLTSTVTETLVGGKIYTNMGIVRYKDTNGSNVDSYNDNSSNVAFATWEKTAGSIDALDKECTARNGQNAVDYTIYIDLSQIGLPATEAELATLIANGQNTITISDKLPEGLVLDISSVKVTDIFVKDDGNYRGYIEWDDYRLSLVGLTAADATTIKEGSVVVNNGTLSLGIDLDEKLYERCQKVLASTDLYGAGAEYYPYLRINYRLTVEDVGELIKNGSATYTNIVTGSFNGNSIGEDDATTTLTPRQAVSKSFVYTGSSSGNAATAPFVYYTVEVNPDAADLSSAGDTLTAVDKMGSALTYDLTSIKVQAYRNGSWQTLTAGTDYRFTYDLSGNSVTFTVPDETYLKITYRARVVLEYSSTNNPFLGWNNSQNQFNLYGYSSSSTQSGVTINSNVLQPDAWAGSSSTNSTSTSITLYKYYTNNGVMTALPGAIFEVVQVTKNGSVWDEVPGTEYTVTVANNGRVTLPDLVWDKVYKVTETKAPSGFIKGEPIYLMVPSFGNTSFPDGVILFGSGDTLYYENEKSPYSGVLNVEKSVEGLAWDDIKNGISFVIKRGGTEVTTISGAEAGWTVSADGATATYKLEGLKPGNYTVEEILSGTTVTTSTGKIYNLTAVTVEGNDVTNAANKVTGNITIADDVTATASFSNSYVEVIQEAELTITKTVIGIDGTNAEKWEKVKDSLTFTISDGLNTYTVNGAELTDDDSDGVYSTTITVNPGTYTVTETNGAIADYALKTVQYQVGAGALTEQSLTSHASVILPAESSETVGFINTYERERATLEINKTVTGLPADKLTEAINNDAIAFLVTSAVTGYSQIINLSDFTPTGTGTYTKTLDVPAGGEYTITEISRNVGGYDVVTEYTVGTGATPVEGTAVTITPVKGTPVEVSFTNTYTQQTAELTIGKTFVGIEGADTEEKWNIVKDSLTFTVKDSLGNTVETVTGSELADADSDGVYTATLNLPIGTYTVTETYTDVTGYTFEKVQYQITAGALTDGDTATVVLANADTKEAIFTNTYNRDKGTLKLEKTMAGITGSELALAENSVSFKIKDAVTGQVYDTVYLKDFIYDSGTGIYTLEYNDLPTGTYLVIEADYGVDGYLTGSQNTVNGTTQNSFETPAFEVEKNVTTEVAYTNTYTSTAGSFTIEKTVEGANWDAIKANISFVVKYKGVSDSDFSDYETILGTDAAWSVTGNVATYVLTGVNPGEYTVEEVLTSDTATVNTKTYRLTKTTYQVTEAGNTGAVTDCTAASNKVTEAVTIDNNGSAKVAFTNTYAQDEGTLTLHKNVTGSLTDDERTALENTIVFVIKDMDTGDEYEVKLADFVYDANTDTYTLASHTLPAGTYTVKETLYEVTGYLADVEYSITGGATGQTGDTTSEFAVVKDTDTEVSFVNNYTKNEAKLTLVKTIAGVEGTTDDAKWNIVKDKLTFTVTDTTDPTNTVTVAASAFTCSGGVYSTTLTLKPGTYTVTETYRNVDGYTLSTTQYQIGAGAVTTGTSANVTLAAETEETVTFTNTYARDKGSLQLDKFLSGLPADVLQDAKDNQKIKFVIKNVDTGIEYPYSLANLTLSGGKYTITIGDLPTGTYIVKEILTDISGYTATVEYSVNDGTTYTGYASETPQFAIKKGETTVVAFSNTYTSTAGSLTIHKQVTGELPTGWEGVKNNISFTITDENGNSTTVSPATHPFTDGDADGIYSYVVTGLVADKQYTVTEVYTQISGYTHTVSYKVIAGSNETTGTGSTVTATISATEGVEVIFTNNYKKVVTPSNPTITDPVEPKPTPEPESTPEPEPEATPLPDGYILRPDGYIETPDGYLIAPDGTVLAAGRHKYPYTGDDSGIWTILFWTALGLLVGYEGIMYYRKRKEQSSDEK